MTSPSSGNSLAMVFETRTSPTPGSEIIYISILGTYLDYTNKKFRKRFAELLMLSIKLLKKNSIVFNVNTYCIISIYIVKLIFCI